MHVRNIDGYKLHRGIGDYHRDDLCESAFTELKRLLASYPVLAFPRLGEPFVVDVDASDVAFGGVLMQRGMDNSMHPVGYFSDSVKYLCEHQRPGTKGKV